MKTLPIVTFNELARAQQLQHQLERSGIPARIHDETKLERFWFMCEPLAAVHVEVQKSDYLRAQRMIEESTDMRATMAAAVRCPECRSPRVEFPQITRKFITPVIQVALMAVHAIPREYYCLDCHYTWPKVKPVRPELDTLGWPLASKFWHPERHHSPPS